MQKRFRYIWCLAAAAWIAAGLASGTSYADSPGIGEPNNAAKAKEIAPHTAPLSVAVLPFDSRDKLIGNQVAEVISANLSADPELQLVEREQIDKILEEQKLSLSAATQPAEAARVGWLVGARVLVVGRAFVIDEEIMITARVVGVETSRVYVVQERGSTKDKLLPVLDRLAAQVSKNILARRNQLVAPDISTDKEKLLTGLAESLKGKTLPKVVLAMPEVHYGGAAPDPAGETEMIRWLIKCGFSVIDPGAMEANLQTWAKDYYESNSGVSILRVLPEDVKIIIIGQAFSEGAGRFGDIRSAKARVEVRALDRKTGQIIAIARRTTAAVDLSENIAGKKAIEDAAASIAYEMIPKLAAAK